MLSIPIGVNFAFSFLLLKSPASESCQTHPEPDKGYDGSSLFMWNKLACVAGSWAEL
jgi:hypothetical protein